ncbi:MAG: hypothetical protein SGILL_004361 [Bacillariaceae sp.]
MLPPVEKCPILALQWSDNVIKNSKLKEKLVPLVKSELDDETLLIVPNPDPNVLYLTATQKALEEQAEKILLVKERRVPLKYASSASETIKDQFTVAERSQFFPPGSTRDTDLFTVHERRILVESIFYEICVSDAQLEELLSDGTDDSHRHNNLNRHDGIIRRRRKSHRHHQTRKTFNLWYLLDSNGWVNAVSPVHMHERKEAIFRETMKSNFFQMTPPLDLIEEYYGPSIAVYFAFLSFLGRWLAVLAIPGVIVFVSRQIRNDTIDNDEYTPFYGLFCFLWAVLLYRFWEREENSLAYNWGTLFIAQKLNDGQGESFAVEIGATYQRPQFRGAMRISPVTLKEEIHYPLWKRKLKYVVSAAVSSIMLSIAFCVMILSLNLQGYIQPKHVMDFHPFHFKDLAKFANEGAIFDPNSLGAYIPVVLHAVSIFCLNQIYRKVATWLTEFENHKTEQSFRNSLILKRFLFECFDCYVALFYLAFYERDVERLRMELVAVFNVDAVRRFGTEVILPVALSRWGSKGKEGPRDYSYDLGLDVYESFDDYMEILIQFGYVALFASAYPMASVAMCVSVWIEIRSGLFRFTRLYQKPLDERSSSIGMWKDLLRGMVWSSCLTNCLLFGFTSDQMLQYIPNLYEQTEDGETLLAEGKGRVVVLLIFVIERILIFAGLVINRWVPAISSELSCKLRRRLFLLNKSRRRDGAEINKKME